MPDLKNNFSSKFAIKTFPCYVANADTGILKSPCTLFDTYLDHILAKFELNCMVQNVQNYEALEQNPKFFKTILTKSWRHFARLFFFFLAATISFGTVLMFRLLSFTIPKNNGSRARVIRLKVAPNTADLTSMKHPISSLNVHFASSL